MTAIDGLYRRCWLQARGSPKRFANLEIAVELAGNILFLYRIQPHHRRQFSQMIT